MKKISILLLVFVAALASCKKTPEVNLKYVDVERDLVTVGTTTANIQCDYDYITTLKKSYLFYGEGTDETDFTSAEMRVVQNTLYVELTGLKANTTYNYYYEFHNGFNSMRTALKSFKTENSPTSVTLPTVVTAAITEITANSAKGGGEVTHDGGAEVTERGICWSTHANPTLEDSHVASGSGTGSFTAALSDLEANTTYHVRAYATNEKGTAYGLDREFVTDDGGCDCGYVDLGLPSGTLWATCNVGANSPEEYGYYFAWGETQPKDYYDWNTYQFCNGRDSTLTKYCTHPECGNNGYIDNMTTLLPEDDAAKANWGSDWRMPTDEEWVELYTYTTNTWTTQNGVYGRLFTASNGNSLFLPAAGSYGYGDLVTVGSYGNYWSCSLVPDDPNCANYAIFEADNIGTIGWARFFGHSVRPVRDIASPTPPTPPGNIPEGAISGLFTINENGDQVYFSQGNLQYNKSTAVWSFMEHQFDMVETGYVGTNYANQNIVSWFGWGTSGWNNGNMYYQPYNTETFWDSESGYGYGPGDGTNYTYDLTGTYANADWGVYNAITNGGNMSNQWRVLTHPEWAYVFRTRTTPSGIRYAKGIVNGVNGIILLPDDWNASIYALNYTNKSDAPYSTNIITLANWEIMETYGAVFLPAAGYRELASTESVGSVGYYWSSSSHSSLNAYRLEFSNSFYSSGSSYRRFLGYSVRLVQDANL